MSLFGFTPVHRGWYDDIGRSHSLFDQFFGQSLFDEDLLPPRVEYYPTYAYRLRLRPDGQAGPLRPSFDRQRSGLSKVSNDKNEFKVCLDVQQFHPEEVSVKTVDNYVVVEGKHEEKEDEHGYIARHFVRKYLLPEGVKPETVTCALSSDGVLAITAPKQVALKDSAERVVPITHTPYPAVQSTTQQQSSQSTAGKQGQANGPSGEEKKE